MLILAELHDFRRFASAPALMAYLGLVPGEDSSGEKHRRGPHHTHGQHLGPAAAGGNRLALSTSPERWGGAEATGTGQPSRVIAIADKGNTVLCRRFRKLAVEHKPAPKIAVAIARELAGFLWAALNRYR